MTGTRYQSGQFSQCFTEAPFLFPLDGKKGFLTNCAETARLVGRSRCCQSPISQRLVQPLNRTLNGVT